MLKSKPAVLAFWSGIINMQEMGGSRGRSGTANGVAVNLSRYFKVVGKIYDHLDKKGKLKDVLPHIQYEKETGNLPSRKT